MLANILVLGLEEVWQGSYSLADTVAIKKGEERQACLLYSFIQKLEVSEPKLTTVSFKILERFMANLGGKPYFMGNLWLARE